MMCPLQPFSFIIYERMAGSRYRPNPLPFLDFTIFVACRKHRLIHSISSSSLSRPNFWCRPPTLAFGKVSSFVDVSDIQVHCAIDDFVTMIDKVHCKAIVKETAVVSTRHTRIDVCYLCQRLHASLCPNFIDHLLLV